MGLHAIDEAKRCLNCKKPRCREGCPINPPIPQMIQMFLGGEMSDAAETVFEIRGKIGGILRDGVPEFRLPKSILGR